MREFAIKNNARFAFSRLACRPKLVNYEGLLENLDDFHGQTEVWFSDSDEYNKAINAITSGHLSSKQVRYLLDIYGMHDNYAKLYPALRYIIETTDDVGLFYKAGDIIAFIEIIIYDNKNLRRWLHNEIYQMFWSRIGSIEAIGSASSQPIIEYALSQILGLPLLKRYNLSLHNHLRELSKSQKEQDGAPDLPVPVAFYVFDATHKHLGLTDKFERVLCSFPVICQLYFSSHINSVKEAKAYLDLVLEKDSLFFRSPQIIMEALQWLLNRRHIEEVELYILQRIVDDFATICEKADIRNDDKASILMEVACRTATLYSEPLKKLGRKCWDLCPQNCVNRYRTVDELLEMASRNVSHVQDQRRFLLKNLRKHAEEVEKHLAKERGK